MTFGQIYAENRRMVVIHHTHLIPDMLDKLRPDDLVFFDDCLFSQYLFLKQNIKYLSENNIVCVLGLSPKALRPVDTPGIFQVESHILHNQLNRDVKTIDDEITGSYINGFMNISEIRQLLSYDNVFLALHGCCHLRLETHKNKLQQIEIFRKDLMDGLMMLETYGLHTDIFVYPYAYQPFLGDKILKNNGFIYIFAGRDSTRISIEEL